LARQAKKSRRFSNAPSASMDEWVRTWLQSRRTKGLTSVREDDSHWRVHIRPVLGDTHVREWTRDDLRALDEKAGRVFMEERVQHMGDREEDVRRCAELEAG
jgi:hypothetical protein